MGVNLVLVIEATYTKVCKGYKYKKLGRLIPSAFDGLSMMKLLDTLAVKYDMEIWYCSSREEMALRIVGRFIAIGKRKYGKR